ncbi:hypothetical protein EZS27_026149 [termite gut metagenome]|uniref:Uncharacterized protein n=1 Tax=termite gut metagenome TaxID=433724 RepID=A0A5J4QSN2_9ZZZZ
MKTSIYLILVLQKIINLEKVKFIIIINLNFSLVYYVLFLIIIIIIIVKLNLLIHISNSQFIKDDVTIAIMIVKLTYLVKEMMTMMMKIVFILKK